MASLIYLTAPANEVYREDPDRDDGPAFCGLATCGTGRLDDHGRCEHCGAGCCVTCGDWSLDVEKKAGVGEVCLTCDESGKALDRAAGCVVGVGCSGCLRLAEAAS